MKLTATPITQRQWRKVVKALLYSGISGFAGGFGLALVGVVQVPGHEFVEGLKTAVVVGGTVGALNSLAVTVKQLFTPPNGEA